MCVCVYDVCVWVCTLTMSCFLFDLRECSMSHTLAGLHSVDQFIGDGEPYSGKVGKQGTPVSWFVKSNHATNPTH